MGFKHEVKHYWNMEPGFSIHCLGETDASNIIDADITDPNSISQQNTQILNKADKFEDRANRLPAPGLAPEHLRPTGTVKQVLAGWAKDIPGVRRCQEWTTELIDDLVKQKLLPEAALAARDAVKAARRVPDS